MYLKAMAIHICNVHSDNHEDTVSCSSSQYSDPTLRRSSLMSGEPGCRHLLCCFSASAAVASVHSLEAAATLFHLSTRLSRNQLHVAQQASAFCS